jgi:uncharacterized protein DUF4231
METTPASLPDYVTRRLEPQRSWHSKRAKFNKISFYVAEIVTLAAGACIPIINVIAAEDQTWQRVGSAALAAVVVLAAGVAKLCKFQENWLRFRAVAEALGREHEMFSARIGDYGDNDEQKRLAALVVRVETLLSDNTAQFLASQHAREAAASAGGKAG